MHKITKGIKKRIKSKKGNKGDDLFDPAELEKYRKEKEQREAAAAAAAAAASEEGAEGGDGEAGGEEGREGSDEEGPKEEDEEWQRFNALTAGVDSILKKSQGDLDRIKSTSYFQRKKPGAGADPKKGDKPEASSARQDPASKEPAASTAKGKKGKRWVGFEEGAGIDEGPPEEEEEESEEVAKAEGEEGLEETKEGLEEEKAPEEEEEEEEEEIPEEEDIFDTSYVDVVASGEVKLAYIPESPTAEGPEEDGFDPFDTSIVEKVIGPEPEPPKGKKPRQLVSLGCAVEVLTGRIDKAQVTPINPSQSSKKRRVTPRRPQDVDLFILDDDAEPQEIKEGNPPGSGAPSRRPSGATVDPFGALDENGIPDTTPIGEALNIVPPAPAKEEEAPIEGEELVLKHLVAEFDVIGEVEPTPIKAEEELIFSTKPEPETQVEEEEDDEFAALAAESAKKTPALPTTVRFEEEEEVEEDDPFDTSVAAGVLGELPPTPQKHPPVRPPRPVSSPDVDVLLGGGKDDDFGWEEFDEDRSGIVAHPPPLRPAPPSTGPPPRPSQPPARPPPITGIPNIDGEFVPSLGQPPLTFTETAIESISRDLDSRFESADVDDPFDTSFAEVAPGRTELRLIESEILGDVEDESFDPRAGENAPDIKDTISSVTIHITLPAGEQGAEQEIGGPREQRELSEDLFDSTGNQEGEFVSSLQLSHRDLLGGSTTDLSKLGHDPISPDEAIESKEEEIELGDYVDPFDTSIVDPKIAPGKAELKIIEKELLGETEAAAEPVVLHRSISDPDFDPRGEEEGPPPQTVNQAVEVALSRPDLLEVESRAQSESQTVESVLSPSSRPDLLSVGEDAESEYTKPLTPLVEEGERISEAILKTDGVDPFDTTFAENILPGKAELRIIESELFGGPDVTAGTGITRSLSDPDFDPRESTTSDQVVQNQTEAVNIAAAAKRRFSDVTALSGGSGQRSARIVHPTSLPLQSIANPALPSAPPTVRQNQPDLLAVEEEQEAACKPLSPARETVELEEGDPFDTSTVSVDVLKPGKAELKILESELIGGPEEDLPAPVFQTNITAQVLVSQYQSAPPTVQISTEETSPEVKPPDLLNLPESDQGPAGPKPLTPLVENSDFLEGDDFDPFDTSIAEGIGPGRTELKLLESELIGQ